MFEWNLCVHGQFESIFRYDNKWDQTVNKVFRDHECQTQTQRLMFQESVIATCTACVRATPGFSSQVLQRTPRSRRVRNAIKFLCLRQFDSERRPEESTPGCTQAAQWSKQSSRESSPADDHSVRGKLQWGLTMTPSCPLRDEAAL